MTLPPPVRAEALPLPCAVALPRAHLAAARYALRMLLLPLGLDPVWVEAAALPEEGLYYGPLDDRPARAAVHLGTSERHWAFFELRQPYPVEWATFVEWSGEQWPVLFPYRGSEGEPDVVASAFFWLSGWQEWVDPVRDERGRFPYRRSLQHAWGLATRPPVDAYREMLAERLRAAGLPVRRRQWRGHSWALAVTHDIDAFRKWRPGVIYRRLLRVPPENPTATRPPPAKLHDVANELLPGADPYWRSFEQMIREERRRGIRATYFFKTGARDPHDAPCGVFTRRARTVLDALVADGFEVGLHPSYHAHSHTGYLMEERDRLSALARAPLSAVRQHYLRYERPATPRLHVRAGFQLDSTLGFSEHEGFRNGTSLPFQLYDLDAGAPLPLWEMPLSIMDATLSGYRGLDAAEAFDATREVLAACRRFGGVCVVLWHNILYDRLDHRGWDRHFTRTLDFAHEKGASLGGLTELLGGWS